MAAANDTRSFTRKVRDKVVHELRKGRDSREVKQSRALVGWLATAAPGLSFALLDVGALGGLKDYGLADIRRMPGYRLVGIEPDAEEARRMMSDRATFGFDRVEPVAVAGTSGIRELHVTRLPGCSSLYPARTDTTGPWSCGWYFEPDRTMQVKTVLLHDAIGADTFDFVKLDIQGCELEVIKASPEVFAAATGVFVEVHFEELYEGEGLFPEIHTAMSALGFRLIKLDEASWFFDGVVAEANCIYVKRPESIASRDDLLRHLTVAALAHNAGYAELLLRRYAQSWLTDSEMTSVRAATGLRSRPEATPVLHA